MNGNVFYPTYITRAEERLIQQQVEMVKADRRSRTVLLYGPGGVGKTSLVRQLAKGSDATTVWLEPIDVDDPECWLLSNLEAKVSRRIDPRNDYFGPYQQQLSQLPSYLRSDISHQTVLSYLGRIKEVFARCYKDYVDKENKTVVITFDTVETIRGTSLLLTLTQWMKALPAATLFILSGREVTSDPGKTQAAAADPIEAALRSPYQGIPVTRIGVAGFSAEAAAEYLDHSRISAALVGEEKDKLVRLTRGHPLWLAFLIDYLREEGMPDEAEQHGLGDIESLLPYAGRTGPEGARLHQAFLRRLVAPYRESDYWHEAVKRLAVMRQPVAQPVWQELMADCQRPPDIDSDEVAWRRLLELPWVRSRGNDRYVTLHDALAEEFAERLFPWSDQSEAWRQGIWRRAREIYRELLAEAEAELRPKLAALDEALRPFDAGPVNEDIPRDLIELSMTLDARRRELGQWRAASLYYLFLSDFEAGSVELLRYFGQAVTEHDRFLQDLLVLYLQRFLPGGAPPSAFNDVVRRKLEAFHDWLRGPGQQHYNVIGVTVSKYLVEAGQPEAALDVLAGLPGSQTDRRLRHRIEILRGDAYMRIVAQVKQALGHFQNAFAEADALDSPDRHKLIAEARKELGFYYRSTGEWEAANLAYRQARDAMVAAPERTDADRKELASIHTHWAYVMGLTGRYRDGLELAESAIQMRHKLGLHADEGLSQSVLGEVYRYAHRFEQAWAAYREAQRLLEGQRNWDRLGFVYQQQAICLYQATMEGINLTVDPMSDARKLITYALNISIAHSIRGYPSALNRAGRIFGHDDPAEGIEYLRTGIAEAQKLSDGWFWFANVIEYAELCYRLWIQTRQEEHRAELDRLEGEVQRLAEDYSFPDLSGRWSLLRGHVAFADYLRTQRQEDLDAALDLYQNGFASIARQHVASSGVASVKDGFSIFSANFARLSEREREHWLTRLRSGWAALEDGSTLLLAHLEELF